MIIFLNSHRNHYVMTPHQNCLIETVQMRGHNICFMQNYQNFLLLSPNTPSLSRALRNSTKIYTTVTVVCCQAVIIMVSLLQVAGETKTL